MGSDHGFGITAKNCDRERLTQRSVKLYRHFWWSAGAQLDMAASIAPMNAFHLLRRSCGQFLEVLLYRDLQLRFSTVRLLARPQSVHAYERTTIDGQAPSDLLSLPVGVPP